MFITLEGPDGSGKTCQVEPLAEFLRAKGYALVTTREPGGTLIGDQVRAVLFDLENTEMHPRAEILLFQASRTQLVEQIIRPALAEGKIVLSDRYADSTLAYQGFGHQTDLEELKNIVHFATGGLTPNLSILLDVDAEVGLRRRSKDGDWNRLDAYQLEFHRRVRAGYHQLVAEDPDRWVVIDGSQAIEVVQKELRKVVLRRVVEKQDRP